MIVKGHHIELPEENCHVLLLLNYRPEELVSDVFDAGRITLQDQPVEDGGLVPEAAVVQVGDPVLVVYEAGQLLHTETSNLLLVSDLHEVYVVELAVVI